MRNTLNNIIDKVVKNVLNEATVPQFKMGDSIVIPGDETYGRKVLRDRYKMNPDDFEYIGAGKFVYKMKPKKTNAGMKKKPKFKSQDLGKKDGETSEEYLDRVKQVNQKFAQMDGEIEGEEWRPIENKGRYFKGNADFSKDFEVSNMGRVRVIDLEDPMRSIITSGYDAPNKKARQITIRIPGMRTTPPLHTLVADAWLPEPPGGIEKYYVAHIDGDYHNNRADNLEYRPKKRSGNISDIEEPTAEMPLAESKLRRMIKESVRRALNEWADGTDTILSYHVITVGGDDSDQAEADFAYEIYDKLTHNEISVDEAIWKITNGNLETATEPEAVPRSAIEFGTNTTGKYFLTYDKFTGALDVWARGE